MPKYKRMIGGNTFSRWAAMSLVCPSSRSMRPAWRKEIRGPIVVGGLTFILGLQFCTFAHFFGSAGWGTHVGFASMWLNISSNVHDQIGSVTVLDQTA